MKDNWHWFIFGAICGGILTFGLIIAIKDIIFS